jgi:hypothetical protein
MHLDVMAIIMIMNFKATTFKLHVNVYVNKSDLKVIRV